MDSKLTKYSLIIPVCNRPDLLRGSFPVIKEAVSAYPGKCEVIIVDNGPDIPADQVVEDMARESAFDVRYITSKPKDRAAALNAGIQTAVYDWIAITDDDCLPCREWLVNAEAFRQTSGVRYFGGRIKPDFSSQNLPVWLRPGRSRRMPRGPAVVSYEPMSATGLLEQLDPVPMGGNGFVCKAVFEEYGYYNEELSERCRPSGLGCEDAEFGMRLRSRGEKIGYCADALINHPVYGFRATLRNHVKWAWHYGRREAFLFPVEVAGLSKVYIWKSIIVSLLKMSYNYFANDRAASVCDLMEAANMMGQVSARRAEGRRLRAET